MWHVPSHQSRKAVTNALTKRQCRLHAVRDRRNQRLGVANIQRQILSEHAWPELAATVINLSHIHRDLKKFFVHRHIPEYKED